MADLKRQLERSRQREAQLRTELLNLQRVVGWIDPAYSAALCDAQELAMVAIRRPIDLGAPTCRQQPDSRPPSYVPQMYDVLRKQRVWQRQQAARIRQRMRLLVDQDSDPEDASEAPHSVPNGFPRNHEGFGLQSADHAATVSVVVPRAPIGRPQRYDGQEAQ